MAIATLLAVLLTAAPVAAPVAATAPSVRPEAPSDGDDPPPGSADDQATWVRLRDAGNAAVVAMGRVSQAAYRLRYGGYYQGLDEAGARARPLRESLEHAAREADDAIPKQGLRVRTCKYTLMELGAKMGEAAPAVVADLPALRAAAAACAREVGAFAAALEPRADALDQALQAVDVFLGRTPARPPTTARGP